MLNNCHENNNNKNEIVLNSFKYNELFHLLILDWNVTVVFKIVKLFSLTVRAVKAAVLDFGLWSPVVSSGVFQRQRIVFPLYWRRVGVCLCYLPFSAGTITLMLGWEGSWQRHTTAFSLSHSSCFWSLISAIIMTPAESKLSISVCDSELSQSAEAMPLRC